jgi:hypothetical protein
LLIFPLPPVCAGRLCSFPPHTQHFLKSFYFACFSCRLRGVVVRRWGVPPMPGDIAAKLLARSGKAAVPLDPAFTIRKYFVHSTTDGDMPLRTHPDVVGVFLKVRAATPLRRCFAIQSVSVKIVDGRLTAACRTCRPPRRVGVSRKRCMKRPWYLRGRACPSPDASLPLSHVPLTPRSDMPPAPASHGRVQGLQHGDVTGAWRGPAVRRRPAPEAQRAAVLWENRGTA